MSYIRLGMTSASGIPVLNGQATGESEPLVARRGGVSRINGQGANDHRESSKSESGGVWGGICCFFVPISS